MRVCWAQDSPRCRSKKAAGTQLTALPHDSIAMGMLLPSTESRAGEAVTAKGSYPGRPKCSVNKVWFSDLDGFDLCSQSAPTMVQQQQNGSSLGKSPEPFVSAKNPSVACPWSLVINISFYSSLGFWHSSGSSCLYCQEFCAFLLLYGGLSSLLQRLKLNTYRAALARAQPALLEVEWSNYFSLFGTPEVSSRIQGTVVGPQYKKDANKLCRVQWRASEMVRKLEHLTYRERQKTGLDREKGVKVGSNFSFPLSNGYT